MTVALPPWKSAARLLLVAAAYDATARAGLSLAPSFGAYVTLLWLPAGIATAAILRWGDAMVGAVVAAMLALGWTMGTPASVVLITAAGNALGPFLAARALRRLGFSPTFGRWRDVTAFCAAAGGGMLVSAGAGALALVAAGLVSAERGPAAGLMWWMGDVLGLLVAGPLLLTASAEAFRPARERRGEFLALALTVALVGGGAFLLLPGGIGVARVLGVALMATVVWAALRFGVAGGSLAVLGLCVLAAAGTAAGRGPFVIGDLREGMVVLWAYGIAAVTLALTISVLQAERARAIADLWRSQQRLELATRAAGLGIWDYDASRDTAAWDARMLEIYGLRPGEFGGDFDAWERAVLPEDAPAVKAALAEAMARREDFTALFRIRRPDGEVRHVEARAIVLPAADGSWRRMIGANRDVTAERRAEERRDELLARLQKIASQVPGVVYQFCLHPDGSASLPYASGGLRDLFQAEPPSVRADAAPIFERIHPADLMGLNASIAKSAATLGIWRHEFRVRAAPGQPERWLLGNSAPQREPDGSILWHGFITDVTERKRAERNLREKNEELERFAHTVSHDLKSPLVTIQTFLGYLEQDLVQGDPARVSEDLGFIRTASAKMSQLIEEVLEISRVGRTANLPARVGFHEIAREVLALTAGAITERGVEAHVIGPNVPLAGDRARLVQVWQNLVENAVKFMREDEPAPWVELGVRRPGAEMPPEFWVRDNGRGIEPRHHARVFGLFEKLDAAAAGTGLGLALVRRIVESFGGRIWLESDGEGGGTCFWFTLPEAEDREADAHFPMA